MNPKWGRELNSRLRTRDNRYVCIHIQSLARDGCSISKMSHQVWNMLDTSSWTRSRVAHMLNFWCTNERQWSSERWPCARHASDNVKQKMVVQFIISNKNNETDNEKRTTKERNKRSVCPAIQSLDNELPFRNYRGAPKPSALYWNSQNTQWTWLTTNYIWRAIIILT